jgi:hypothetical protein
LFCFTYLRYGLTSAQLIKTWTWVDRYSFRSTIQCSLALPEWRPGRLKIYKVNEYISFSTSTSFRVVVEHTIDEVMTEKERVFLMNINNTYWSFRNINRLEWEFHSVCFWHRNNKSNFKYTVLACCYSVRSAYRDITNNDAAMLQHRVNEHWGSIWKLKLP